MASKIKLTRPELKKQRDALARYERFLPMLKLKQQQLQISLRTVARRRAEILSAVNEAMEQFQRYSSVLSDMAGVNVRQLAEPAEVKTSIRNVAGVRTPSFEDVVFPEVSYSLFGTPPWVDRTLMDLRDLSHKRAQLDVLLEEERILRGELSRIVQRVNLFEKVKIPDSREAVRRIRIFLGDEMAAAVGRAKIAKSRLVAEAVQEEEPES